MAGPLLDQFEGREAPQYSWVHWFASQPKIWRKHRCTNVWNVDSLWALRRGLHADKYDRVLQEKGAWACGAQHHERNFLRRLIHALQRNCPQRPKSWEHPPKELEIQSCWFWIIRKERVIFGVGPNTEDRTGWEEELDRQLIVRGLWEEHDAYV
jgi:hypothetical protein